MTKDEIVPAVLWISVRVSARGQAGFTTPSSTETLLKSGQLALYYIYIYLYIHATFWHIDTYIISLYVNKHMIHQSIIDSI